MYGNRWRSTAHGFKNNVLILRDPTHWLNTTGCYEGSLESFAAGYNCSLSEFTEKPISPKHTRWQRFKRMYFRAFNFIRPLWWKVTSWSPNSSIYSRRMKCRKCRLLRAVLYVVLHLVTSTVTTVSHPPPRLCWNILGCW